MKSQAESESITKKRIAYLSDNAKDSEPFDCYFQFKI